MYILLGMFFSWFCIQNCSLVFCFVIIFWMVEGDQRRTFQRVNRILICSRSFSSEFSLGVQIYKLSLSLVIINMFSLRMNKLLDRCFLLECLPTLIVQCINNTLIMSLLETKLHQLKCHKTIQKHDLKSHRILRVHMIIKFCHCDRKCNITEHYIEGKKKRTSSKTKVNILQRNNRTKISIYQNATNYKDK